MASNSLPRMTGAEYLAYERAAEEKSEFIDGEMFAMSGASVPHVRLERNLTRALSLQLETGNCEVFGSNLRVRVDQDQYTYPDLTVVCGKPILADDQHDTLLNPVAIFEVLSPSTERYDRGRKFQLYRRIRSLTDYILVDQSQILVEHYVRQEDNSWKLTVNTALDESIAIERVGASLRLAEIYERVNPTPERPGAPL